ncbi:hypothetical protein BGZ51_001642 [Haplosporangium sp. Z 767]|nr:hypothetical protein BGZ51_001642 [Haplosporangium sp. Z 767]
MGAVNSSLNQSVDWIRGQGAAAFTSTQDTNGRQGRHGRNRNRDRSRRHRNGNANRARRFGVGSGGNGDSGHRRGRDGAGSRQPQDIEARGGRDYYDSEEDYSSDLDSLDDDQDDDDEYFESDEDEDNRRNGLFEGDEDDSATASSITANGGGYDNHPLYFGPAFHPVTEQSPAQLQLQRQIEQQLEQQQRQEYWQQQYRHQQQLQQQQQVQQQHQYHQQQQQQHPPQGLSSSSTVNGQQLSLNDFILPSAISGMGGIHAGSNGGMGHGAPHNTTVNAGITPESVMQDQLYRNSNLYNLISGLNVNPLLTEVQRAGTLDLSVLEQELDDVEGGWVDIDDDEDNDLGRDGAHKDNDNHWQEGIVREMQPTKRSPTAMACNINLKKSTLRLVKNFTVSNDPSIPAPSHLRPNYRLDFCFDSLTPCDVKLFWVVKEVEEDGDLGFRLRRLHHLPQPTTYHFPAGMNQRFISPILPLYTMSLPELTMQGLPSTSMRMFQKRNQWKWQLEQQQQQQQQQGMDNKDDDVDEISSEREDGAAAGTGTGTGGERERRGRFGKRNKKSSKNGSYGRTDAKKYGVQGNERYPELDDGSYKAIMEDQYYPLVILIEATKEYKATGPVRSLPTPAVDSPGLYLVDNQAISTFACFNISSEGGFEIKVMKQKVWINSTNYLIQEIYGFTDSVASTALPKAPEPVALKKTGHQQHRPQQQQQQGLGQAQQAANGKRPVLTRPVSRLSRAESIASRVEELTKERPRRRGKREQGRPRNSAGTASTANDDNNRKDDGAVSSPLARKASTSGISVVSGLDVQDLDSASPRTSVLSVTSSMHPGNTKRNSAMSLGSVGSSRTTDVAGMGSREGDKDESVGLEEDGEQTEGVDDQEHEEQGQEEEEPNLVLLDAPECVICLSDVKDTIVLPCRHFCICSECGDILRRRAPQRCPICRRGKSYKVLMHME